MYGLLFKTESTVSLFFWIQIITVGNFQIGIYVAHLLSFPVSHKLYANKIQIYASKHHRFVNNVWTKLLGSLYPVKIQDTSKSMRVIQKIVFLTMVDLDATNIGFVSSGWTKHTVLYLL